MNTGKIGTMFLVSVLVLASVGITYAGFYSNRSLYGTVDTATVNLDIVEFSGTWVYKVWGWTDPQHPPDAPASWKGLDITWDPAGEVLICRGFDQYQPTETKLDDWVGDYPGTQWEAISHAQANPGTQHGTPPVNYDVDMEWDNIFPCIDFIADVVVHYTGSIPAHIAQPTPTWIVGEQYFAGYTTFKAYWYTTGKANLNTLGVIDLHKGNEITTWPIQVHECQYVGIEVWIHLPQLPDNSLQDKHGEFNFNISSMQWNECTG